MLTTEKEKEREGKKEIVRIMETTFFHVQVSSEYFFFDEIVSKNFIYTCSAVRVNEGVTQVVS